MSAAEQAGQPAFEVPLVAAATSPVSILLVDDNAAKRLALRSALSPLGHTIVEAESGLAALRHLMEQDFAVILLDVRMPTMDGFETAALIRKRQQSESTPIIFVTAHGRDEIRSDLYEMGAVDVIFAPVQPHELRAKVAAFSKLFTNAAELAARALEVQASADQLRLLTDAAPVGIFQTDAENRYIYTNPRWTEVTGITAEAAFGECWDTIIGSTERAGLIADRRNRDGQSVDLSHRFEIQVEGSSPRIVDVTSRSVPDRNGGIAGWVGTLADVTAEAGAEAAISDARDKANEASQLKSDFLANMSHEIRTPMNGVIGMTDLLLETKLDASQRDYAQTVRNSGEALLTVINDILDFSKVEAGKLELDNVEFGLRAVVDGVVELLAPSAQVKGVELVVIGEGLSSWTVNGDSGRVRQVLTNLIGNAIKFTHVGEVAIRIAEPAVAGDEFVVRFEISDTGDGIDAGKLDSIFQPFVQGDSSSTRRYGGTGLGLSISGQLVALMGGDCGVTSELGSGSTFWFTIRVGAACAMPEQPSDDSLAGVRVLIVDDNATQRSVLSERVAAWGMNVSAADSGADALRRLRAAAAEEEPFALAVIDHFMPELDGLELVSAIVADAELKPGLVLMTDLGQESAATPGIGACLSKPIRPDQLRSCLRVALNLDVANATVADALVKRRLNDDSPNAGLLLLAEDNVINQKVAVAMLTGAGYRVDTVTNGAEAVQAVAALRYDAVLMDIQMPELNGYEATAAIRMQEGSTRHTPIIAMTAGARREDRERCLAEGMDSYLAKPVSKDALLAMVAWSVNGRL